MTHQSQPCLKKNLSLLGVQNVAALIITFYQTLIKCVKEEYLHNNVVYTSVVSSRIFIGAWRWLVIKAETSGTLNHESSSNVVFSCVSYYYFICFTYHNRISSPRNFYMATSIDVTLVGSKEGTNTLQHFFVPKKNLIIFCVEEGKWKTNWGVGEVLYVY